MEESIKRYRIFVIGTVILMAFYAFLLFACSSGNSQVRDTKAAGIKEKPTEQPHKLPELNSDDQKLLSEFSPKNPTIDLLMKNSAEVYTSDNFRAYAYNEVMEGKLVSYMYGGSSEENQHCRWFCQRVFQWDPSSKKWQPIFDSGLNFSASITKDITLKNQAWYYTAQWVWDPLAKEWLKFDSNLLFQNC
jgi:hypothetical protein